MNRVFLSQIKEPLETIFYKMSGDCIFCKIIQKNNKIIYQDEETAVFAPLKKDLLANRHLLVVPKDHYRSLFDIPSEKLDSTIRTAKFISNKLEKAEFDGVNILHASEKAAQQSVDHFHLHLIPRKNSDDLDLWPKTKYRENDYQKTYSQMEKIINSEK